MRNYLQETDSKMVFSMPSSIAAAFPVQQQEMTSGYFFSKPKFGSMLITPGFSTIKQALRTIASINNKQVANFARNMVLNIQEAIDSFKAIGFAIDYLPRLQAFNVDDGSVLIEWIFENFRIGFSIESDLKESSWYLVSDSCLGEISASGYLSENESDFLVTWLVNFVFSLSSKFSEYELSEELY